MGGKNALQILEKDEIQHLHSLVTADVSIFVGKNIQLKCKWERQKDNVPCHKL